MIDIRGRGYGVRGGIVWATSVVVPVEIPQVFPGLEAFHMLLNRRLVYVVVWRWELRYIQN